MARWDEYYRFMAGDGQSKFETIILRSRFGLARQVKNMFGPQKEMVCYAQSIHYLLGAIYSIYSRMGWSLSTNNDKRLEMTRSRYTSPTCCPSKQ
jgi:hypothetical protein